MSKFRKKTSKGKSKKVFNKGMGTHVKNTITSPSRGGIRL